MRLSRVLPTVLAILLSAGLYAPTLFKGSDSDVHGRIMNPLDGPLSNLPLCTAEDGSGMDLCVWQAGEAGNGQGSNTISGDCAPTYVGSDALMHMCIKLYAISNEDAQQCNDEYIPDMVELKHCYARFLNEESATE
jgi:hypothetical protein